ncbi:MAG: DNA primase [Rhodobacteraceae bacterium]|nr:DNA primase [Paracoccaceae bacterium]
MSLPPGFLDELRSRTTLSHVVGRKVTWDQRKSNQAKGDLWAPCPFHQEKTASFHVDDRKGFYYCFGCHAKGDAISFLKDVENMPFMEAVETLAREVGMAMPAADPKAAERADRRTELAGVMEEAMRFFRMQLKTSSGAAARDYLVGRKLTQAALDRFEIGFAPEGWQGLWETLRGRGIAEDLILGAGLARPSTRGKAPYDTFRNRIMFPIRDARGRCIAFGGRALDPNDSAKYLNSPETDLFDKGRSLYNHGPARDAAGKGQPLIVAEGYMDVIALVMAGFDAAVAPLGTAITEDQLQLLWRLHPEPLIMLDGDAAGIRAATRLIDLALPRLQAGQGLRFVILPEGMDPDDLIRIRGKDAMSRALSEAQPMVNLLWRRETEGREFDSPERKAALDKSLRETLRTIGDRSIRSHYGEEIKRLRWELFGAHRLVARRRDKALPGTRWRRDEPAQPLPETKASLLAAAQGAEVEDYLREAMILAIAITHPACAQRFESQLETVEMRDPGHARLRHALLTAAHGDISQVRVKLEATCAADLEKLFHLAHVHSAPPVRNADNPDFAAMCLAEELAKLDARRGVVAEIEEAVEDLTGLVDEGLTWRLSQAVEARHRAARSKLDDDSDMGEDRAALSAELQRLIDTAAWEKKKH